MTDEEDIRKMVDEAMRGLSTDPAESMTTEEIREALDSGEPVFAVKSGQVAALVGQAGAFYSEKYQNSRDPFWVGLMYGMALAQKIVTDGPGYVAHLVEGGCNCVEEGREQALETFGITAEDPAAEWQQSTPAALANLVTRLARVTTREGEMGDPWRVGFASGCAASRMAMMKGESFLNRMGDPDDPLFPSMRRMSMRTLSGKEVDEQ